MTSRLRSSLPFLKATSKNLLLFTTWIPAIIFFNDHIGELAPIQGASMYPYLNEGFDRSLERDICWVGKWGIGERGQGENGKKGRRGSGGLERGMIVSILSPTHPEIHAIKRIIALPGDTVTTKPPYPVPLVTIPPGHIWVEGDGRGFGKKSLDSNVYGPVPINLVQGELRWVVWPPRNWGEVRWWEFRGRGGVVRGVE